MGIHWSIVAPVFSVIHSVYWDYFSCSVEQGTLLDHPPDSIENASSLSGNTMSDWPYTDHIDAVPVWGIFHLQISQWTRNFTFSPSQLIPISGQKERVTIPSSEAETWQRETP